MSTLCAGCGHDSVTAALVQALWELEVPPHRAAKMSGIGCSSKTTAYFLKQSHGFNSVHGRMPALATGANAANRELVVHRHLRRRRFAVDRTRAALPRHPPQREHAVRAREQRRVRAHQGTVLGVVRRRVEVEEAASRTCSRRSIRCCSRSRSARPSWRAASPATRRSSCRSSRRRCGTTGFALVDVISPCVSFNDHEARRRATATRASTTSRSRRWTSCRCGARSPPRRPTAARVSVTMHDGSVVRFRRVARGLRSHESRRGVRARARATATRRGRDRAALHRREPRRTCTPSPARSSGRSSSCRTRSCVRGAPRSEELMDEYR